MDPLVIYILFSKSFSKLTLKFWSEPVLVGLAGLVWAGEGRFRFRFRTKCPELN